MVVNGLTITIKIKTLLNTGSKSNYKTNKYQLKRSKCQINIRCQQIIHGQRTFTESLNFDLKLSKKSIVNER